MGSYVTAESSNPRIFRKNKFSICLNIRAKSDRVNIKCSIFYLYTDAVRYDFHMNTDRRTIN